MHPIEHLRYLARSGEIEPRWVVPEAADALEGLSHDRLALVMAGRKLVEALPVCGPLWWLCGNVLCAVDPGHRLGELRASFDADPTPLQSSLALAEVPGDAPDLVDALIVAESGAALVRRSPGGPDPDRSGLRWVCAGVGTVVPDRYFARARAAAARHDLVVLDADRIDRYVRPGGVSAHPGAAEVPLLGELTGRG